MDLSLKPHPLIAHWIPGFVLLALLLLAVHDWSFASVRDALAATGASSTTGSGESNASRTAITVLFLSVAAFVVGELIDAARDLLENLFNDCVDEPKKIKWEFFFCCTTKHLDNMEQYFFTYYVFAANFAIALVSFLPIAVAGLCFGKINLPHDWSWPLCTLIVIAYIVAICLLTFSAADLREHVAEHTRAWLQNNPNHYVEAPETTKKKDQ